MVEWYAAAIVACLSVPFSVAVGFTIGMHLRKFERERYAALVDVAKRIRDHDSRLPLAIPLGEMFAIIAALESDDGA